MTAEVRTGQPEDVSELSDALAPDTSPAHTRQRWHEHTVGHREMLVAELDGRLAGCVGISVRGGRHDLPGTLRLLGLDVGPCFRRRGVGTALVRGRGGQGAARRHAERSPRGGNRERHRHRPLRKTRLPPRGDPIINRWLRADEVVEELSWVMVRRV